jgi:hypothetical protein|tara:strand:+ start:2793 stop:3302 length:510 start_codon:yes stop_codon:yes gene_type:complete
MPTPNDSIKELILQDVETTLAAINGPTATYFRTVNAVERYTLKTKSTGEVTTNSFLVLPLIVIQAMEDEPLENQPGTLTERLMTIRLFLYISHDDAGDDASKSSDQILNEFQHDIEVAIMADHTLGGNALATHVGPTIPFDTIEDDVPLIGIIIDLIVQYRHNYQDPSN